MIKQCKKCKKYIDKSDSNITWVNISTKWFYLNDKLIKGRRILLCGECGLSILHDNDI